MVKELSASIEDYLEAILQEVLQNHVARVKDIADRLAVGKSAASEAIRQLKKEDLVSHETYGWVRLTSKGEVAARDVARRHAALKDFFVEILGIGEDDADRAACAMEHAIPPIVEDRLREFMDFFEKTNCRASWQAELGVRCDRCAAEDAQAVVEEATDGA